MEELGGCEFVGIEAAGGSRGEPFGEADKGTGGRHKQTDAVPAPQ